jgi:DNA-binding transcriptional MerR regulator
VSNNGPLHTFLLKHRDEHGMSLAGIQALCEKAEQLTKREQFAMAAMQGMLAQRTTGRAVAVLAVRQADALIEELNKK